MASRKPGGPQHFQELIAARRVLVFLGAGGVGKTTTSIACALAAARAGRRVALLSIDPARRLAAALGIALGNELRRVQWPAYVETGTGTVDAAMLDQKAVFDAMVHRHAPNPQAEARILAHPVYRAISANLSGPLEYMALAKLQELAEDARYDLIILDTPPDTHALDFLARPNLLGGFMESRIMTWLVKPFAMATRFGFGRALSLGERLMGGVAKVTGMAALSKFADFLVLIQDVIEGFHRSGERVVQLLREPATGFALVAMPTSAAVRAASHIARELERLRYRLDALVLNRCLPTELVASASVPKIAWDQLSDMSTLHARAAAEYTASRTLVTDVSKHSGFAPGLVRLAEELASEAVTDDADTSVRAIVALAHSLMQARFDS